MDGPTLHLFAYGTLMCPEIMTRVVTCLPASLPARLDHYRRGPLRGVDYPAIVACPGASVEGLLYLDLPEAAWRRLDEFEDEIYTRQTVTVCRLDQSAFSPPPSSPDQASLPLPEGRVRVGSEGRQLAAETYVLKDEFRRRLGDSDWSFAEFLKSGKGRFTREYDKFPQPPPKG